MKKRIAQATVIIMMAALIICLEVMSHPWWYLHISYGPNNLHHYATSEEFLEKMEKLDKEYSTDIFSRNSDIMLALAKMYDYNEYVIPALMCIETNGGNNIHGNFNYWNLKWYDFNPNFDQSRKECIFIYRFGDFETEEEAFNTLSMLLHRHYSFDKQTYHTVSRIWLTSTISVHNSLLPTDSQSSDVILYKKVQHIKNL